MNIVAYRPDKERLHKELALMKKQHMHTSECITYVLPKEDIEKYLSTKYKYKI